MVCQITCYRSTTIIPLYLSCHAFHSLRDFPRLGHKLEPIFRLMIIILLPYDHRISPPPNLSNLQLYYIAILQSSMNFPQSSNAARCTSHHHCYSTQRRPSPDFSEDSRVEMSYMRSSVQDDCCQQAHPKATRRRRDKT